MSELTSTPLIVMLQALGNAPARLESAVEHGLAEADAWRAEPGEWTVRETVAHLAAAEAPFLARLRRILAEDNPRVPYFGPAVARPEDRPLPESLARYRAEREALLSFLAELTPEAWERPAIHETQGPTTLGGQVQNIISHDMEHLGQVHKARQAWEAQPHG